MHYSHDCFAAQPATLKHDLLAALASGGMVAGLIYLGLFVLA